MHVLCAPDSFRGTITAADAADALAAGIESAGLAWTADACPIADGGEGTLDVLVTVAGGRVHERAIVGPDGSSLRARFARLTNGMGVVELAEASGLARLCGVTDPTRTTTYGTGQLIMAATELGCSSVMVTLGGSATCDGGCGLAQACGVVFHDANDVPMTEPITGGDLQRIARITTPDGPPIRLRAACDVTNPLLGATGAATVFAPQKGATPEQVETLERGLAHLVALGGGAPDAEGAGAAGGSGYGLATLLGAELVRGGPLVLDTIDFDKRLSSANVVITGEGRLDPTSTFGKACRTVTERAAIAGVPVVVVAGDIVGRVWSDVAEGISLTERFGAERARSDTAGALRDVAASVALAWAEA